MRSIQSLGLTCIAALGCGAAVAEEAAGPAPHMAAAGAAGSTMATAWQPHAAGQRYDRLQYLNGSACIERADCTTSASSSNSGSAEREYMDALNLGTYGPMKFKFTGDRVKLKVRF